jgi:YfiR/HmsC-like
VNIKDMVGRSKTLLVLGLTCMLLAASSGLRAQQDQRAVRAAYLFNLSKYVSWPQEMRELRICSLADQHTGLQLKQLLDGKTSDGRAVHVVLDPPEGEQRQCAILYLDGLPPKRAAAVLQNIDKAPVLTVGDDSVFAHKGGMVGLVRAEDQIQLVVNMGAMRSAGIRMSSRLLDLAIVVQPESN